MASDYKGSGIDKNYGSDHPKSGDRMGMGGAGTVGKRDYADRASDIADDVSHKAKEAGESLMDKASDFGHSVQETGHNVAEKSRHTHQAICDFTKENPTAAVLLAFGLGAILARVLPGR